MANKRDFKKEVDGVFATVIEECLFTADAFPAKRDSVDKIIDEAVTLYQDTRFAYKMDEKMSNKAFYNGLMTNYMAKMSEIITKLNAK